MKNKKRHISLIVALALLMSCFLFSVPVSAENSAYTVGGGNAGSDRGNYPEVFNLTLLADFEDERGKFIYWGEDLVFTFDEADTEKVKGWFNTLESLSLNTMLSGVYANNNHPTVAKEDLVLDETNNQIIIPGSSYTYLSDVFADVATNVYAGDWNEMMAWDLMVSGVFYRCSGLVAGQAISGYIIPMFSMPAYFWIEKPVLTVEDGDTTYSFTERDLTKLWEEEGSKEYEYSTYSTFPTFENRAGYGPTVEGLLAKAGVDVATLADNDVISFVSEDGYTANITAKDFKQTRYYYPNGATTNNFKGTVDSQLADKVEVPYFVDLASKEDDKGMRNTFGQLDPQEQNLSDFCQYLSTIKILRDKATEFTGLTPSIEDGSFVAEGDVLNFDLDWSNWNAGSARYSWIYYTVSTDGTEPADPTISDTLYNYKQYHGSSYEQNPGNFNSYTFTDAETTIIKVMTYIRGYADPVVTTLTYHAEKEPTVEVDATESGVEVAVDSAAEETLNAAAEAKLTDAQKEDAKELGLRTELKVTDAEPETGVVASFEEAAGEDTIAFYLDIVIDYYLGDQYVGSITEIDPITITVDLPESAQGYDEYSVICEHDGEYEVLPCELSSDGKSISFETGKFSTYAIAYAEAEEEEEKTPVKDTEDKTENKTEDKVEAPSDEKVANTADNTPVALFVGTVFVGFLGAVTTDYKRKRV